MRISVIKSFRRRKTASARIRGDTLYIRLPALIGLTQEKTLIEKFLKSFHRKKNPLISNRELKQRAQKLNRKYFEGKLSFQSITWSDRQNSLYGSCSTRNRTIRISSQLTKVPKWVLEAIIFHELTHLMIRNHSKKFWEIANRFPMMERARGYLMALGHKDMD